MQSAGNANLGLNARKSRIESEDIKIRRRKLEN